MAQLVRSIADPFHYVPPPVGCGTNIPLSRASFYLRTVLTVPASNNFLIIVRPCVTDMVTTYTTTTGATVWSAGTLAGYQAQNKASINARFQSGRVIAGGAKVRILTAAVNAPPLLMGGLIYDSYSNIIGSSMSSVVGEQQMMYSYSLSNSLEVTHRAVDQSSYDLIGQPVSSAAPGAATFCPTLLFAIQNNASATVSIAFDALYHFEGNSGMDYAGDDTDDTMAASGYTLEQVTRAGLNAGPITTDRLTTQGLMDTFVSAQAARSRNFSLHTEGGLVNPTVPMPQAARSQSHDFDECKENEVPHGTHEEPMSPASKQNVVLSRSLFQALTRK